MFKIAPIALIVSLAILGSVLVFRSSGGHKTMRGRSGPIAAEPSFPEGQGPNEMPDRDHVVIDGQNVVLPKANKGVRQRALALVATIKGADEELQAAERGVEVATIELDHTMAEIESLQQSVREAESELVGAKLERNIRWAIWRNRMDSGQKRHPLIEPVNPGSPPLESDIAVGNAELRLEQAKQRYQIQYSQITRRIEQARLQVRNSQTKITVAKAARERAKADLFEMLPPPIPK